MAHLTPKTTAERLGISTRWLGELSKRGVLPKHGRGRQAVHPWPDVRDAYNDYLKQQGALEATVADLQAERAQLVRVSERRLSWISGGSRQNWSRASRCSSYVAWDCLI